MSNSSNIAKALGLAAPGAAAAALSSSDPTFLPGAGIGIGVGGGAGAAAALLRNIRMHIAKKKLNKAFDGGANILSQLLSDPSHAFAPQQKVAAVGGILGGGLGSMVTYNRVRDALTPKDYHDTMALAKLVGKIQKHPMSRLLMMGLNQNNPTEKQKKKMLSDIQSMALNYGSSTPQG